MTPVSGPDGANTPRGIRASVRRVVAHATALVRLEKELVRQELERKGTTLGAGVGVAVAAGFVALYAFGFGLAALAAAIALAVDWWLALLIVFLLLVLAVVVLVLVARTLVRKGTPLAPEQAIEEARLTKDVLRGTRAG